MHVLVHPRQHLERSSCFRLWL